jgi:hypothetical protein
VSVFKHRCPQLLVASWGSSFQAASLSSDFPGPSLCCRCLCLGSAARPPEPPPPLLAPTRESKIFLRRSHLRGCTRVAQNEQQARACKPPYNCERKPRHCIRRFSAVGVGQWVHSAFVLCCHTRRALPRSRFCRLVLSSERKRALSCASSSVVLPSSERARARACGIFPLLFSIRFRNLAVALLSELSRVFIARDQRVSATPLALEILTKDMVLSTPDAAVAALFNPVRPFLMFSYTGGHTRAWRLQLQLQRPKASGPSPSPITTTRSRCEVC